MTDNYYERRRTRPVSAQYRTQATQQTTLPMSDNYYHHRKQQRPQSAEGQRSRSLPRAEPQQIVFMRRGPEVYDAEEDAEDDYYYNENSNMRSNCGGWVDEEYDDYTDNRVEEQGRESRRQVDWPASDGYVETKRDQGYGHIYEDYRPFHPRSSSRCSGMTMPEEVFCYEQPSRGNQPHIPAPNIITGPRRIEHKKFAVSTQYRGLSRPASGPKRSGNVDAYYDGVGPTGLATYQSEYKATHGSTKLVRRLTGNDLYVREKSLGYERGQTPAPCFQPSRRRPARSVSDSVHERSMTYVDRRPVKTVVRTPKPAYRPYPESEFVVHSQKYASTLLEPRFDQKRLPRKQVASKRLDIATGKKKQNTKTSKVRDWKGVAGREIPARMSVWHTDD